MTSFNPHPLYSLPPIKRKGKVFFLTPLLLITYNQDSYEPSAASLVITSRTFF